MSKYTLHEDAGHAWLEVPKIELKRLGIAEQITSCSYQNNKGRAFLEEDLDAGVFIDALEKAGEVFTYERFYKDPSPIREYMSYIP